jgi:hydroxypyruvate isomerase
MPRLAANLSMMFNEVAFLDRFAAARAAGFEGVEFLFPYEFPAAKLRERLSAEGLTQVLFNMPPGDWANGERGMASLPGRQAEFRESVKKALDYAAVLDCRLIHCMEGAAIVEAIGSDRLGLQFDVYHVQVTEGDITKRMEQFMPVIAHMQIADVPARNEPGTGEIGWAYVFRRMDELGYSGWVGCEYRPAGDTVAGLTWRERFDI